MSATRERAFEGLRRIFSPEGAAKVDATVQFSLTGEGGVEFFATIRERALQLEEGRAAKPKVTMRMPALDFLDMVEGRLSSTDAFFSGKLKVGGNLIYAMKLAPVFRFADAGK